MGGRGLCYSDEQEEEMQNELVEFQDAANNLSNAQAEHERAEEEKEGATQALFEVEGLVRDLKKLEEGIQRSDWEQDREKQSLEKAEKIFGELLDLSQRLDGAGAKEIKNAREHFNTELAAVIHLSALKGKIGELFIESSVGPEAISQWWFVLPGLGRREVDVWDPRSKTLHEVKCWASSTIKTKISTGEFGAQLKMDEELVKDGLAESQEYHFLPPDTDVQVDRQEVLRLFRNYTVKGDDELNEDDPRPEEDQNQDLDEDRAGATAIAVASPSRDICVHVYKGFVVYEDPQLVETIKLLAPAPERPHNIKDSFRPCFVIKIP